MVGAGLDHPGVAGPAREAYQRATAPLPSPPLPTDPLPRLSREDLVALAADAAARCLLLAEGTGDGGLGLDERQNLARRGVALGNAPMLKLL